jgi:hypothetical protein
VIALARKLKTASSVSSCDPRRARRSYAHAWLTLAGSLIALLLPAIPAGAIVVKVESEPESAEVGLQRRNTSSVIEGNGEFGASFANAGGNPVLHGNATYDIFWDPTNAYDGDWQRVVNTYLRAVGTDSGALSNVFSVYTQYTDRSNVPATYHTVYKGAYTDTDGYPGNGCNDPHPFETADQLVINGVHKAVCLTDSQLREELQKFVGQHGLAKGMGTIYDILTPPGLTVCLDGGGSTGHCSDYSGSVGGTSYKNSFCSYHGAINPGGSPSGDANTVLYAAVPWTAGGLGDPHLLPIDRRVGYDCQDGGFDPSSKPLAEEPEHTRELDATEEKEFEEANAKEKQEKELELALEGPHAQEPNQGDCPGADGGCDAGLADLIVNQLAVEQQNIVTDPLLNGWQDSAGNEGTDECRNFFAVGGIAGSSEANDESFAGSLANQQIAGGAYYINDAFNLAAFTFSYPGVPCVPGVQLEPRFTSPNPVNAGELVGFDGMESTITLNAGVKYPPSGEPSPTYPTYTWNFGDGTPTVTGLAPGSPSSNSPGTSPCEAPWLAPCAAAAFHSYQYGGTYPVTLTVKDVGGNTASFSGEVTVDGPPPPAPPSSPGTSPAPSPGGGSSGGASTGSTVVSGIETRTGTSAPKIVATQAVASHSLASALRGGLVVRYSVSAQATGRFEVLLASSVARRIHLKGPAATGLAPGTPPQVVIAKAILVTTKGGTSSYRIKFSKATAARLRKLHKVSLMIRMVVHNASSPVATTVLSTANLSR